MIHYNSTSSQAINRRVTKAGMSTLYIQEQSFASFVMSLVGLCYLPLEEITQAIEELKNFEFSDKISPEDLKKIREFQAKVLQYLEEFWIFGDFHPSVWNFWMHGRNNTNNR